MLKGLSSILKKAVQVAAPIIGAATPLGPVLGAAAGSGLAGLLAGQKPKDALLSAGLAGLGGAAFSKFGGAGTLADQAPKGFLENVGNRETLRNFIKNTSSGSGGFFKMPALTKTLTDGNTGLTGLGTGLAVGLPSVLAYMGAAQDAKRAQPMDPKDYRSYVDDLYGGPVARPPEDRRITNLITPFNHWWV